ncbi:hypothetical protein [Frankia sp. AvcI1]|uniref:hypothetical protein n=1 Tax=Frankia sp. AvcI1 TaxID=573496 RepID=UPI0003185073|nr:hypothetical protein [Frankia sp. AvcI1]
MVVLFVLFVLAAVWLVLQILRARLLGHAIRVTEQTLPVLQEVLSDVRERLDYRKPVDVYVVDKAARSTSLTSYLGTRIIILEGDLVADLQTDENRGQLTFLIARYIGALKARHQQLMPVLLVLGLFQYLAPFRLLLLPYVRATAYSGDQIGQSCADLRSALTATNRLLVGKDLTPSLAVRGVFEQAVVVRRKILPRLAQLGAAEPHLTNRYLNLYRYAAAADPDALARYREALDDDTTERLDAALQAAPGRRGVGPRLRAPLIVSVVSGTILVLAGLLLFGIDHGETAQREQSASPADTSANSLLNHIPSDLRPTCQEFSETETSFTSGLLASQACFPSGSMTPDNARYYQYDSQTSMNQVFDTYASDLTAGGCPREGVETYPHGRRACYVSADQQNIIIWTDTDLDILAYGVSKQLDLADLTTWWSDAGPE